MPPSPQTTKLTSTLHLLIPRLRLHQKKDTASSVIQRRELASLLTEGRDASARIRVENVIATDTAVEVMEVIELYCELLLARANVLDYLAFGEKGAAARRRGKDLLKRSTAAAGTGSGVPDDKTGMGFSGFHPFGKKQPQPQTSISADAEDPQPEETSYISPPLDEAAVSIFYAWTRFPHDIRELTILRTQLAERWGKEFMALAAEDKVEGVRVPERLVKGLSVRPPSAELVGCYLAEIARAYGVSGWSDGLDSSGPGPAAGEVPGVFGEDQNLDLDLDKSTDRDKDGEGKDGDDGGAGGGGGGDIPEPAASKPSTQPDTTRQPSDLPRSPSRGLQPGRSPVSVAPPGPRTDNPSPRVKMPETSSDQAKKSEETGSPSGRGGIPEVDELTRRFAALRR